jgi:hemoglobin
MQRATKYMMVLSTCLAVLVLAGTARTQDKKPAGKPLDRAALDESIYQSLRGIIDHGADLYNQGDWSGCYRLWEGALMSLKAQVGDRKLRSWTKTANNENTVYMDALNNLQTKLGDHPGLKEVIDTALESAKGTPQIYRRAFILRVVLDQIRAETRPAKATVAKEHKPGVASEAKKTLWDRLGGEPGVTKIVDDFVNLAAPDPKVDFFRDGKLQMTPEQVVKMKRELVEQISAASGGPLKYKGPDMKKIHKGMGITDAQFNAAAADLKKALEMNNVAPEDAKKILGAVGSYRKEIVEPKKPEEKQREEKNPAAKKEEKKLGGKVSVRGSVTFKGKPLTGGTIILTSEDGKAEGTIAADGSYKVEKVKPGDYTVSFKEVKGAALPTAYGDPKTTPLRFIVKDGKQTFDISLQ